jgi:hypothetical protein
MTTQGARPQLLADMNEGVEVDNWIIDEYDVPKSLRGTVCIWSEQTADELPKYDANRKHAESSLEGFEDLFNNLTENFGPSSCSNGVCMKDDLFDPKKNRANHDDAASNKTE